jgi:hypothetical protein
MLRDACENVEGKLPLTNFGVRSGEFKIDEGV